MQIKSGQGRKIAQNYNKRNNNIYHPKKVVINNTADLYKLPVDVIKNSKIYDFSGDYFNEIYEEALKIERNNEIKKLTNPKEVNAIDGEKYAKAIEEIEYKLYSQNLTYRINIEQRDKNIFAFNNKEIALKFDKNGRLKLLDGTDLERWIIKSFGKK